MTTGFRIDERVGTAGALHASWPAAESDPTARRLAVCSVTTPAIVLGSTQPERHVDTARAAAAGVDLVRRRSGGGAVLVAPGSPVWVDAWVPIGDPLWQADVGRSFEWFGTVWCGVLERVGAVGLTVRPPGRLARSTWSDRVCFAGLGPGEVCTRGGRKVVGLAQRRTGRGAWIQSTCLLEWDPAPLVDLLALGERERLAAIADLGPVAVGAVELAGDRDGPVDRASILDALLAVLA